MKAKLIKEKDWYDLYRIDEDGKKVTFASTQDYKQKLSLKNCQAIERGYDLDELVEGFIEKTGYHDFDSYSYKLGFQKALEILGDKKFSEKELTMLFAYGHQIGMNDVLAIQSQHSPQPMPKPDSNKLRDELIQSLQQNEWEVEVEMEEVAIGDKYTPEPKPKLDAENCLILKRL